MTDAQFALYHPKYAKKILAIARTLLQRNDALMDDLSQEGLIALWEFDLASVRTNEDSAIRSAIRNQMIDYLRKERPAQYESLDRALEHGDQVVGEPGAPRLIRSRREGVERQGAERDAATLEQVVDAAQAHAGEDGPSAARERAA